MLLSTRLCLLLFATTLGAGAAPDPNTPPRTDGVYRDRNAQAVRYIYLFPDGELAFVHGHRTGAGTEESFSAADARALGAPGRYKVKGGRIELSFRGDGLFVSKGTTRAEGSITADGMNLTVQMPGWKFPDEQAYEFVPRLTPAAEQLLGASAPRTDGVYRFADPYRSGQARFLRFNTDGSLVVIGGPMSADLVEELSARPLSHFAGYPIVRPRISGDTIEFEEASGLGVVKYRARVGSERVELQRLGLGRVDWEVQRYYEFVAPPPPPTLQQLFDVRLGRAVLDERCEAARFTPDPGPFPAGTREIAYELALDPRARIDARVHADVRCGTPSTRTRSCNGYSIVNGQPVVTRSTVIVSCADGGPFRAGRLVLRLEAGAPPAEVKRVESAVR